MRSLRGFGKEGTSDGYRSRGNLPNVKPEDCVEPMGHELNIMHNAVPSIIRQTHDQQAQAPVGEPEHPEQIEGSNHRFFGE